MPVLPTFRPAGKDLFPGRISRAATTALALLLSTVLLGACDSADAGLVPDGDPPRTDPPPGHAWVVFGADTVTARVADTDSARAQGLQGVTNLPDGEGMLFVFESNGRWQFWMLDTPIDLDIAFLDADFTVVSIATMTANSRDTHAPPQAVRHALEVPAGWFAAHGIIPGARAEIVFGPP